VKVAEIGRQRAFDGFVVAENLIELLRQRQRPVAVRRKQFRQRAQTFAGIFQRTVALRERANGGRNLFHFSEQLMDAGTVLGESLRQRLPGGIKIVRQQERLVEQAAAHFVKRAGRNPFDGVEHARARQHSVFGSRGSCGSLVSCKEPSMNRSPDL